MTKIIKYILMICLTSSMLVSCTTNTTEVITTVTTTMATLEAPSNLIHNNNIISWDSVENATEYDIHINGNVFTTSNTEYTLTSEGTFEVTVVAIADNYFNSVSSEMLSFTLSFDHNVEFNLTLTDNILTWDAIDGAESYYVVVNGYGTAVDGTSHNVGGYGTGYLSVKVQAVFPIGSSDFSEPVYYESNLKDTDPVNVQYSINSVQDIILCTLNLTSNTIILNSDSEVIDLNDILINSDQYLTLNSDYITTLELGENSLFVIIGPNKTEVIITVTDKTNPYIISSTGIHTDGTEDIYFQLELFGGSLYSVNGAAEDTVLYEMNGYILTIESEFIADKFITEDFFVLSFVIKKDDTSVIGYMFFYKE
ncbi:MAG: hypothetical protein JEZ05_00900 [Tenericutes bacterium]|nr:hypothetical protein [Mycoplasmatota bacterium]